MSSANLVEVTFVEETTYDTPPTNDPGWETLRMTQENFSANVQVAQSDEIRSDRMVGDQFKVSTMSEGGFQFEFSAGSFDTLLDGVMMKTVAAGVWVVGSEDKSYTISKNFTDLTANHYFHYSGMRVSEFEIGFEYGEAVKGLMNFAGATVTTGSTDLVGTGSVAAATTTRVMNAVSDLSGIEVDGVAFTGCLRSVNLSINNNLRPAECIGSDTPSDQILGTALITGTISAYLTDTTIQWYTSKVLSQSQFDIRFTISDGSSTYEFDLPNCRINGEAPSATGINNDVMIEAEFTALYDSGSGSSLTITKT